MIVEQLHLFFTFFFFFLLKTSAQQKRAWCSSHSILSPDGPVLSTAAFFFSPYNELVRFCLTCSDIWQLVRCLNITIVAVVLAYLTRKQTNKQKSGGQICLLSGDRNDWVTGQQGHDPINVHHVIHKWQDSSSSSDSHRRRVVTAGSVPFDRQWTPKGNEMSLGTV